MTDSVSKSVLLACSKEHAFHTFVERVDLWWPPGHRKLNDSRLVIEAAVGGRFFEQTPAGESFELGAVIDFDPPHRIVLSWNLGKVRHPTRVEVRFESKGAETRVLVEHTEGAAALGELWPERAVLFRRGWEQVLRSLLAIVETEQTEGG